MPIGGYSIGGYCWLNYHKLLVIILLVVIGGYWWLFYWWLLVVILLVAIGGYFIGGY
jgi:hypothetical protein